MVCYFLICSIVFQNNILRNNTTCCTSNSSNCNTIIICTIEIQAFFTEKKKIKILDISKHRKK